MVLLSIILCYLLGLSLMLVISRKYSLAELLGYSFLLGIGLETFFLFLLDIVGIKYSPPILISLNLAITAFFLGISFRKLKEFKLEPNPVTFFQLKNINIPALLLGGIMVYLFYAVSVKCLFWPPLERDTFGSFDKLARVMAIEGKLKISLFDYHLEGAAGIYPPLFHAAMAYVYVFGAELPKIITTLFFASTLLVFFDILRKYMGATVASFFTLLFMLTPEYFAHAALALGNLPTAAYACAGGLCTIAWLDKREEKFFWLGAINMGLLVWIRSDTIVFTAAALLIMGIDFLRTKDWKKLVSYGVVATLPFILWALYLKFKIQYVPANKFNFGIGYNSERWGIVWGYVEAYLFGGNYSFKGIGENDGGQLYGLTFLVFFLFLFINAALLVYFLVRKQDWKNVFTPALYTLVFFVVSFFLYMCLFYFINEDVQAAPLWSLMYSSFKRGMFCFIPFALFYAATGYSGSWLFSRIEKFRTGA